MPCRAILTRNASLPRSIVATVCCLVNFDKDVMLVGRVNRLELWGLEQKMAETEKALSIDPDELDFDLSQTDLQL